jgi:mitotic spindle assembly checkpoint protein MAD2B
VLILFLFQLVNNHNFLTTIQGLVERVVVIFYDKAHVPVEKFVFKLAVNQSYGSKIEEASLEFALRAFLIKLAVAEPLTRTLPSGTQSTSPLFFHTISIFC